MASFNYRKARRERMLAKMRRMREAKERKRMANPVEPEPRMEKWNRFEVIVVDRLTGERGSFELRSLRDAGRRLAAVVRWV